MGILGSRFGIAGIVAAVLGAVIGWLLIDRVSIQTDRASLQVDLADTQRDVAILQGALNEQNGAVVTLQEAAARDQAERTARALRTLAPPQRATPPKTVQELNTWLASP